VLDQCPHCEKPYVDTHVLQGQCPHCGISLTSGSKENEPVIGELDTFSPLIENTGLSLLARFWGTVAQILFRPTLFFHSLMAASETKKSTNPAYLFGVFCLFIGQIMSAFWVMQLSGHSLGTVIKSENEQALWAGLLGIEESSKASEQINYFIHLASIQAHLEFVLAPLIAFFILHLWVGGCFGLSRIFKTPEEGPTFDFTLRWVAYAQGPFILAVIPSIGALVATGWVGMLLIRGLMFFHQMRFMSAFLLVVSLGSFLKVLWSGVLHRLSLQIMTLFFPNLT
jgi:hypothetical protein